MDRELLLEIGVEEMPASWLPSLIEQLKARLLTRLTDGGLPIKVSIEGHATPRRLTACVPELVDRQEDRDETIMGPPVSAAFDAEGHPTNAGLGFARKLEADFDALVQVDTPKGKYLSFTRHHRGKATVDALPEILGKVLRDLTFPKQMHWDAELEDGKGEFVFGRPIRWLLFLYGGRVVPFTIARQAIASSPRVQDVTSGAVTYGHRFLATSGRAGRAIKVRSFDEYQKKLAENFVVLSRIDRRDRILRELESHARKIGGRAMLQQRPQAEALLEEVPDLVEFPAVVSGAFSAEFLELPEEVLTTTLIHHQKFFPVLAAAGGGLMPAFLAVTNTQSNNERAIGTNAERVVAARLRDARFFWDADRQVGLEGRLERLDTVLFHKQHGSYRAKAERIERLARWIATDVLGRPNLAETAGRAARLAKADLATDMVREFTELQGTMGGIYARVAGEPEAVWKAIYSHYLPLGVESNSAPTAASLGESGGTWAAVSLADKLDTLVGLLLAGEKPTGSRDPFGLRRQTHGILRILLDAEVLAGVRIKTPLATLVAKAREGFADVVPAAADDTSSGLAEFLFERLHYVFEARGADKRTIRAVLPDAHVALGAAVADLAENLKALPEFSRSEGFRQLATAFKRVRNIGREYDTQAFSKDEAQGAPLETILEEPAEKALLAEIEQRRPVIEAAVTQGTGFREAYVEASHFEPVVSRFFEEVFVMSDDMRLRQARLRLMKRLETLILRLSDISEIVASE